MNKKRVKRPWGEFRQFTLNEKRTVKVHTIKPNQLNSLQKHKKRDEFWHVLEGPAKIIIGKKTIRAKTGDEFMVKKGQLHRWGAYSKPAKILEITFGIHDEKDIIRVEDSYGRAS